MSVDGNYFYNTGPVNSLYNTESVVYRSAGMNCGTAALTNFNSPSRSQKVQQSYSTAFYDNISASPSTFLAGKSQALPDNRSHHHHGMMITEGGSAVHGVTQLGVGGNSQQIMSPASSVLSDCNINPLLAPHQSPAAFLSNQDIKLAAFLENNDLKPDNFIPSQTNNSFQQQNINTFTCQNNPSSSNIESSYSNTLQQSSYAAATQLLQSNLVDQSTYYESYLSTTGSTLVNAETQQANMGFSAGNMQQQQADVGLSSGNMQQQQANMGPSSGNIQQQQANMGTVQPVADSVTTPGGLEFLYRETDRLMRNRSTSMTDVLTHRRTSCQETSLLANLDNEFTTSLRLGEDDRLSSANAPPRRGSGTFQRSLTSSLLSGAPGIGRKRFPSMDPAALSSGGGSGGSPHMFFHDLPLTSHSSTLPHHQSNEDYLASLFSGSSGSSPIISPMDSIWAAGPPLHHPTTTPSTSSSSPPPPPHPAAPHDAMINPIEEFVFQSDDDDEDFIKKDDTDKTPTTIVMPKEVTRKDKKEASKAILIPDKKSKEKYSSPQKKRVVKKSHSVGESGAAKKQPVKNAAEEGANCGGGIASWSQVVRSRAPATASQSPVSNPPLATFATAQKSTVASTNTNNARSKSESPTLGTSPVFGSKLLAAGVPEFHRGPKVDPRWPVEQQVFLGPIPVAVTWDEIRNCFYEKVDRHQILHTYIQSKPVNDVVYGQVVFDKYTTANKILKEGSVKIGGYSITVTAMKDKTKAIEKRK
eukprot:TRINITY_DN6130_c0_g1_i11.p1 TRINITY_DN6130_c0_g1~~TRINITY_DN6130_c0_g1_i11.p1  ORF type:complete len:779 (+),score=216.61 TRINITY_DN6130_c0_g1_i11:70-2337(+)